MRSQSSAHSAHSSLDHAMTIPENDELSGSQISALGTYQDVSSIPSGSALSSPSISSASLLSLASAQSSQKHFCRSQTGIQLLKNQHVWSRYALRQISLDSSTGSLTSTTSSTAVLLPLKPKSSSNKRPTAGLVSPKSTCSMFESDQHRDNNSKQHLESNDLATFEDKLLNLHADRLSLDEDIEIEEVSKGLSGKHRRGYSVWRTVNWSNGRQIRQIIKRSSSTGRINTTKQGLTKLEGIVPRPVSYAYKVLPYLWVGNIKSCNCDELLSDGGCGCEIRLIRRRVHVDFCAEKRQATPSWPPKRPNLFDYMIPMPRRGKLNKKILFLSIVEFCKIVNKAKRDATQVLAYGYNIYLAQLFAAAYLIVMFNKTSKTALNLISSRAGPICIPVVLLEWLNDLRNFLDRKSIMIGRVEGDIIFVSNIEAERSFCRKYLIVRGDEAATPNYQKYIDVGKAVDLVSFSSSVPTAVSLPIRMPFVRGDSLASSADFNQMTDVRVFSLNKKESSA